MASVVGLLEERELAARERVEGLREEADRVLAALAEAETDWQEWLIARQRVSEVLTAPRRPETGVVAPVPVEESSVPEPEPVAEVPSSKVPAAGPARAGSIVPVWRPALTADVLAMDYQRILSALVERRSGGDGVMTCQEIAVALGLEPVPACVEGVRSKMKRLADRGWAAEPAPGRFTLADGPACGS
ncbi:hypothetical protein [Streptomyces sp. ME19-01-6]|uniref:hypothetical protein n=1 Tax=Streptomyces sp. ME19-01-6 TaxID=3028686 RepID=UPI0029AD6752|nr:hypothetical protein [Streptomyces sp. ME19-01-6]MDX3231824.1 hypothetical protein [Streptomyces sp. ME19-01-6]